MHGDSQNLLFWSKIALKQSLQRLYEQGCLCFKFRFSVKYFSYILFKQADTKEVLPASSTEGPHAPSKGGVTSSRRSLDDFSQRKKRIGRLKTKGRSKPRGNRTVSLATPRPDTRESSSEDDISAILRGKKGSRSLSLISKFWLDSSSDGSESSVCREKGARQGKSKTSKKGKVRLPVLILTMET